jgi:hypothetical protein
MIGYEEDVHLSSRFRLRIVLFDVPQRRLLIFDIRLVTNRRFPGS